MSIGLGVLGLLAVVFISAFVFVRCVRRDQTHDFDQRFVLPGKKIVSYVMDYKAAQRERKKFFHLLVRRIEFSFQQTTQF